MKINWIDLINKLLSHGISKTDIGKAAGLSPASIIDLLSGRQATVKWEAGNALLRFYEKEIGQRFEQSQDQDQIAA